MCIASAHKMAPGISPTTVSDRLWFARRPIYPAPTNFAAETTHFLRVAVVAAELSGFASRKIRTVCPLESAPHSDSRGMPPFFAARFPEPASGQFLRPAASRLLLSRYLPSSTSPWEQQPLASRCAGNWCKKKETNAGPIHMVIKWKSFG